MKPQSTQRAFLCSQKEYPHKEITGKIISCAIEVHSQLGPGLLESIYEEALTCEFDLKEITYERQKEIFLKYKGRNIGQHRIDFLIENEVIVELKAVQMIHSIYEAQLLTYLRAMRKRVGLLLNFNVEMLKDVSFRVAPISEKEAYDMISEIRAFSLLKGLRGEKPVDMDTIAECLLRLSQMVVDFPEITELDINPLSVKARGEGAVAIDARILIKEG